MEEWGGALFVTANRPFGLDVCRDVLVRRESSIICHLWEPHCPLLGSTMDGEQSNGVSLCSSLSSALPLLVERQVEFPPVIEIVEHNGILNRRVFWQTVLC